MAGKDPRVPCPGGGRGEGPAGAPVRQRRRQGGGRVAYKSRGSIYSAGAKDKGPPDCLDEV